MDPCAVNLAASALACALAEGTAGASGPAYGAYTDNI